MVLRNGQRLFRTLAGSDMLAAKLVYDRGCRKRLVEARGLCGIACELHRLLGARQCLLREAEVPECPRKGTQVKNDRPHLPVMGCRRPAMRILRVSSQS